MRLISCMGRLLLIIRYAYAIQVKHRYQTPRRRLALLWDVCFLPHFYYFSCVCLVVMSFFVYFHYKKVRLLLFFLFTITRVVHKLTNLSCQCPLGIGMLLSTSVTTPVRAALTATNESFLQSSCYPRSIFHVALTTRQLFDRKCIHYYLHSRDVFSET